MVFHGKVYTEDPKQKWAEAVAIRDGKIVFVGTDQQIQAYRGPSTRAIDAGGHLVLPGFTDAHVHFIGGSTAIQTVALDSAETVAEIQKRVKAFASAHPDKKVITGYGWMYPVFGKAALPNKKILDEVVPDRPVILRPTIITPLGPTARRWRWRTSIKPHRIHLTEPSCAIP